MKDVILKRQVLIGGTDKPWMSDAEVRIVTWRVLKALEFMHSLSADGSSILHRDLKPDNVMLARRGPDGCGDCSTAKLADLGHSKLLDGVSRTFTDAIGTAEYSPPEIAAARLSMPTDGHTKALDMWTVGVLLYVCFIHTYPFGTAGDRKKPEVHVKMVSLNRNIVGFGLRGTTPEALRHIVPPGSEQAALFALRNEHARKLMQTLLQAEARDRPRVEDALRNPWFDGIEAEAGAGAATP